MGRENLNEGDSQSAASVARQCLFTSRQSPSTCAKSAKSAKRGGQKCLSITSERLCIDKKQINEIAQKAQKGSGPKRQQLQHAKEVALIKCQKSRLREKACEQKIDHKA
jgi:hypothetical protein